MITFDETHSVGLSGRGIGPPRGLYLDNTQYSLKTNINVTGRIRTRNPSHRAE